MDVTNIDQTVVDAGVVPAVQSRLSAFSQYLTESAKNTLRVGAAVAGVLALAVSANIVSPSEAHAQTSNWATPTGWGASTGWGAAINDSAKKNRQAQVINSATQLGAQAMGATPMESGLARLAGEAAGALSNDNKVVQNTALGGAAALLAIYATRDNKGQAQQQNSYGNNGAPNAWGNPGSAWGGRNVQASQQPQQASSYAYQVFQERVIPLYQQVVVHHMNGNAQARDDVANQYFMTIINAKNMGVAFQPQDRQALMEVVRTCPQVAQKYGVGMDQTGNVVALR